jgi:hypothetical protein
MGVPRRSDPLTTFSHRLVQAKVIIIDSALFLMFLYFVAEYLANHFGIALPLHRHEMPPDSDTVRIIREHAHIQSGSWVYDSSVTG